MFNLQAIKKHYALVPVVGIIGGACVMCAAYIGYMGVTKPDVNFRMTRHMAPGHKAYQSDEGRKLMQVGKVPRKVDPEVEALKREVGNYARGE